MFHRRAVAVIFAEFRHTKQFFAAEDGAFDADAFAGVVKGAGAAKAEAALHVALQADLRGDAGLMAKLGDFSFH